MEQMFHSLVLGGKSSKDGSGKNQKVEGTVVLMKKNVLDLNDDIHELLGKRVSLQLISSVTAEPVGPAAAGQGLNQSQLKGKLGEKSYLEWGDAETSTLTAGSDSAFKVAFDWDESIGLPEAFVIKNNHHSEFYLKTVTLKDVPGHGRVHFVCNSWVYPAENYKKDRVFFANKAYLPHQTPHLLVKYREEELVELRGTGTGEPQEWDRIYDYAYYNDLGNPDKGPDYARPVLGGSTEYPYPRRGRTGRSPSKTDPDTESRLPLLDVFTIKIPRDERFGQLKTSDFLGYNLKSIGQALGPALESQFDRTPGEFDSFEEVLKIYEGGIKLPDFLKKLTSNLPSELLKAALQNDGDEGILKYPMPQVIKEDKSAWRTDEEFGREMLAGVNPLLISRLQEFPPTSKLDPEVYGNQNSSITRDHIEKNLNGLTVEQAIENNRLFMLDHHDLVMLYLRRINTTSTKTYATRTILFLKDDGTLKPLAIELSLPDPRGDKFGAVSEVHTPAEEGVDGSIWQLAKAYAAVNDSGYHQLISHWFNTHAVIEPFVIAANRQLSVLHPIYKLLHPHFRDTMHINAFGRQIVINAGGILELTLFPAKYSMEMSSIFYKNYWVFPEQALPADLMKRGVAIEDKESPHGLRLLIDDYPYAVDGLEIWGAIKTWVADYCSFYYPSDDLVQKDPELQAWWKELVEEGHSDKKHESWWPKMQSLKDLIETCTIIIWVASAVHASVNFGMYPYAGHLMNRPTLSRRFMPKEGTPEYEEVKSNPEKAFLKTITAEVPALLGISLIEIASRHSEDEIYLGQRDTPEWTKDSEPLKAFEKFGNKLVEIEERILGRNGDRKLKNRMGPVKIPYTLLYPTSESGLTGKGIPNSISM